MAISIDRCARPLPLLFCLLACAAPAGEDAAPYEGALYDHHVHLLSPQLVQDWKRLGVPFSKPDEAYTSPAHLLDSGDDGPPPAAGAVLVPMGHLYANADFRTALELSVEQERARLSAENDHVLATAERWGDRVQPLASIDFTRPYARDEAERALAAGAHGLKLHLGSASPDLTDPAVLAELSDWFAFAVREDVGVLLHLDPQRRGLEVEDVTHFLRVVLGPIPDARVQIAHLGGSGGFGAWTQQVLGALTDWLDEEREAGRPRAGIRVDPSAVLLAAPSEGVPATTEEEAAALGDALRRLGLERVVFGSDAPVFQPGPTFDLLRQRTDLTEGELARVAVQRLRYRGR